MTEYETSNSSESISMREKEVFEIIYDDYKDVDLLVVEKEPIISNTTASIIAEDNHKMTEAIDVPTTKLIPKPLHFFVKSLQ